MFAKRTLIVSVSSLLFSITPAVYGQATGSFSGTVSDNFIRNSYGVPARNAPAGGTTPNLTDDPIGAHAVVFTEDGRRFAMVTVDSIGLFDTTMDQIRAAVHRQDTSIEAGSHGPWARIPGA